jgi:hypothetical protein
VALAILAFLAAAGAQAQENRFVGKWSGKFQGITINYVIEANLNYSEMAVAGTLRTAQSGKYRLAAPNQILFEVQDWQPKTQNVYHATGTTGGYTTPEPMAKPAGGSFSYVFNNPNSVTLTDLMTHGAITLNRVP